MGFPGGAVVKSPPASARGVRDLDSIPGSGNGNPLQYSCLGNSMDRGAQRTTVHGVVKSQTRLNTRAHTQLAIWKLLVLSLTSFHLLFLVSLRFKCNTVHLYLMHSIVLVDQIEFESNSAVYLNEIMSI